MTPKFLFLNEAISSFVLEHTPHLSDGDVQDYMLADGTEGHIVPTFKIAFRAVETALQNTHDADAHLVINTADDGTPFLDIETQRETPIADCDMPAYIPLTDQALQAVRASGLALDDIDPPASTFHNGHPTILLPTANIDWHALDDVVRQQHGMNASVEICLDVDGDPYLDIVLAADNAENTNQSYVIPHYLVNILEIHDLLPTNYSKHNFIQRDGKEKVLVTCTALDINALQNALEEVKPEIQDALPSGVNDIDLEIDNAFDGYSYIYNTVESWLFISMALFHHLRLFNAISSNCVIMQGSSNGQPGFSSIRPCSIRPRPRKRFTRTTGRWKTRGCASNAKTTAFITSAPRQPRSITRHTP